MARQAARPMKKPVQDIRTPSKQLNHGAPRGGSFNRRGGKTFLSTADRIAMVSVFRANILEPKGRPCRETNRGCRSDR
jgi:hypothetical protein